MEAAILIPVLFALILMLCQPAIMLYDQMVMEGAAAEGCRLLATRSDVGAYSGEKYEAYIKRRLASIPPLDIFHAHVGARTWEMELTGDETSAEVAVRIVNRLRPLPLVGWGISLLGMTDSNGYIVLEAQVRMPTQPSWVWDNSVGGPSDWTEQWK